VYSIDIHFLSPFQVKRLVKDNFVMSYHKSKRVYTISCPEDRFSDSDEMKDYLTNNFHISFNVPVMIRKDEQ